MLTFLNYMPYAVILAAIALITRFIFVLGSTNKVDNRPRQRKHDIYRWEDKTTHRHLR